MLILFRESFFFIDTKINCFTVRGKPKLLKILEEMNFFLTIMIIIALAIVDSCLGEISLERVV